MVHLQMHTLALHTSGKLWMRHAHLSLINNRQEQETRKHPSGKSTPQ